MGLGGEGRILGVTGMPARRLQRSIMNSEKTTGRNLAAWLGILVIALGFFLTRGFFDGIASPYSESRLFVTAIWIGQLLVIGGGLYLLVKRPLITRTNLLLLTFSCLLTLVFAEVGLRVLNHPRPFISGWKAGGNVSNFEINQLCFRGQPIEYTDADYVVVLLGDSQVQAMSCAYEWMPERRLQHYLNAFGKKNVNVFSVGSGGYGQDQQLLALQEYYQTYRTDLVVLWVTLKNDVWNNMFPTHWPANGRPKPTFWLVGDQLHGPTEKKIGSQIAMPRIRLLALWQRVFSSLDRDGEWEQYLPEPYTPLSEYQGSVSQEWQERWERDLGYIRHENLSNEKSHLAITLTPRSPRMEHGIKLTNFLLNEIEKTVVAHNGELVIFYTAAPMENSADEQVYVLNGSYYRTSQQQFNENKRDIFQDFHSYTIPITIPAWRVGPENAHLNQHATDQVMRDLADKLVKFVPEPRRSQ